MNPIFKIIKRRLLELAADEHLQPFTGKKRADYDVDTHSLYVKEDPSSTEGCP